VLTGGTPSALATLGLVGILCALPFSFTLLILERIPEQVDDDYERKANEDMRCSFIQGANVDLVDVSMAIQDSLAPAGDLGEPRK
jgi:hypothetical protein